MENKIWQLTKTVLRNMYRNHDGTYTCFTCGKVITQNKDAHTSHFIPRATCGLFLRYNLRNLRICCYHCNINLGGNGAYFYKNLILEKGHEYVEQLFRDKNILVKNKMEFYKEHYAKLDEHVRALGLVE